MNGPGNSESNFRTPLKLKKIEKLARVVSLGLRNRQDKFSLPRVKVCGQVRMSSVLLRGMSANLECEDSEIANL